MTSITKSKSARWKRFIIIALKYISNDLRKLNNGYGVIPSYRWRLLLKIRLLTTSSRETELR